MSVNLLLSPNSRDLHMSKLNTNTLNYAAGATSIIESNAFAADEMVFDADTTQVAGTVYTLQNCNYCLYGNTVLYNISLTYTTKGTAGAGDLFIDLPQDMPESETGYFVTSTARFGTTSVGDNSNGYAQFDEGTGKLRLYRDVGIPFIYGGLQEPGYILITGSYVAKQAP